MEKLTKQTIKMMLDKYFEGTSTLQEEKALRAYFTSGQFDPEFAEIAPMFEYFADEADHDHKRVVKRQFRINRNTTFRIASVMAAASLVLFTFLMWPQQNENELKLMINGISVNNNELAKSKATIVFSNVGASEFVIMASISAFACAMFSIKAGL